MSSRIAVIVLSSIAAWQAVAVSAQSVKVTPDLQSGEYVVTYEEDGVTKEIRFEPATKVKPRILADIEQQGVDFVYRYSVSNLPGAKQQLYSISIHGAAGVTQVEGPPGWESSSVKGMDRVYWYKRSKSLESLEGIAPGDTLTGFAVRSSLLPGPVTAMCRGNLRVARTVPPALPLPVLQQLSKLMEQDQLRCQAVAPSIPPGHNEPELTPQVMARRILLRYTAPLLQSQHASADVILKVVQSLADREDTLRPEDVNRAGSTIAAMQASDDPWAANLAESLRIALTAVSAIAAR